MKAMQQKNSIIKLNVFSKIFLTLFFCISTSYAQKISSAALTYRPRGSDDVIISGVISKNSLNNNFTISVEVSPFKFSITKKSLKLAKDKHTLSAAFRSKGGGIKSASLDTKSGKFTFLITGVAFSPSPALRTVRVSNETTTICRQFSLLPVAADATAVAKAHAQQAARYGRINFNQTYKSKGAGLACSDNRIALSADTTTILPKTTTPIEFRVVTAKGSSVALTLYLQSTRGGPSGKALCTFVQDSAVSSLAKCSTSIKSSAAGVLSLLATGTINGASVNESLQLAVAPALSTPDLTKIATLNNLFSASFTKVVSAKGNSNDAKSELIATIRKNALVREAGISANGVDVYYVLISGVQGVFPFGLRDGQTLLNASARSARPDYSSQMTSKTLAATVEDPGSRVFVYDPKYFSESEGLTLLPIFNVADSPAFALDYRIGEVANDVTTFKEMSGAGTVIITTHGLTLKNGDIAILSRESESANSLQQYADDLQTGRIVSANTNIGTFYSITPSFVRKYLQFSEGSVLFGGFCYSAFNDTMSAAFLEKGLSSYYGFTERVDSKYASDTAVATFCSLLVENETTGEAYDHIDPKIDPISSAAAEFKLIGQSDTAYSESDPKVELSTKKLKYFPDQTSIFPIKASFGENGELPCISYDWKTPGKLGSFLNSGQQLNEVKTDNSEVSYKFNDDAVFGTDSITVDFLRRSTGDKITSEKIELEPYCPVDTKISYTVATTNNLGTINEKYKVKVDEIANVEWNAPGTDACLLSHKWVLEDERGCVSMSLKGGAVGDSLLTPDKSVSLDVRDCFAGYPVSTQYDFSVSQNLYTTATQTDPAVDLHNKQSVGFTVTNDCVEETSPGVFKELCCDDETDNDGDNKTDCNDPDCASSVQCLTDSYDGHAEYFEFARDPLATFYTQYSYDVFSWPRISFPAATKPDESWCLSLQRNNPNNNFVADSIATKKIPNYPAEIEYKTKAKPGDYGPYWDTVTASGYNFTFTAESGSEYYQTQITKDFHNNHAGWVFIVRLKPAGGCRH